MNYINFDVIRTRFKKQRLFYLGWEREITKGDNYNAIAFGDNWRGERGGLILRSITFNDNLGEFLLTAHPYKGIIKYEISNGWHNNEIIRHIHYNDDFILPTTAEEFDIFMNQEKYHPGELEM